jgi:hypothetical protein
MEDDVGVGGGIYRRHSTWTNEELLGPMPPAPEFSEPLEIVRERVPKAIEKVIVPRELPAVHPGSLHPCSPSRYPCSYNIGSRQD